MPLSENEQRILAEMERSLSSTDPGFAKTVKTTHVYHHSGVRLRWAVLGFVAGLALVVTCFSFSTLLGFAGVGIMFASAVVAERHLRTLGRASLRGVTQQVRDRVGDFDGGRFRRSDDL
jgi:hypothetical protein